MPITLVSVSPIGFLTPYLYASVYVWFWPEQMKDRLSTSINFLLSLRLRVILIIFLGVTLHNVLRNIVGVTMVCMVSPTSNAFLDANTTQNISQTRAGQCSPSNEVRHQYLQGDFHWTTRQQSYIFQAMAWGQLFSSLLAGMYSDSRHTKSIVTGAFTFGAICTFVVPFLAPCGYLAMVVVRFAIGIYAGFIWPCFNAIVARFLLFLMFLDECWHTFVPCFRWVPSSEINSMYALVTAGNQISAVILMPLSTFVCSRRHLLGGWPLMYYLSAIATFVWVVLWLTFVTESPNSHKHISKQELDLIGRHKRGKVAESIVCDVLKYFWCLFCIFV